MAKQSCKNCKWLRVKPNRLGHIVVLKNRAYECTAPIPEVTNLPSSVTDSHTWRRAMEVLRRDTRYVYGKNGENCPAWEAR